MIELPVCRWREEPAPNQFVCRSNQFLMAPNQVRAEFCAQCHCADHDPQEAVSRALPCVHLGGTTDDAATFSTARKRVRHDVFVCALHGRCISSGMSNSNGKIRCCESCTDYLPRDPFGPDSAEMKRRADAFLAAVPAYPKKRFRGRGVVIAGGGDRYFASLYVTIRALRHVGCRLPIQVWYLGRNDEMPRARKALLAGFDVECVDADKVRRRHPARILDGWELKVFATLHCSFEELLFLDADCYPCRNPEFLFDLEAYRAKGAIFWPDSMPIDGRLKWSAFGLPDPKRPGSVESGQFVVDKRACWPALNLTWFYNDHSDYYYRYGYGDKHTFEAAWTRVGQSFVMFAHTARVDRFGYLHVGPDGRALFLHRCSDKFRVDVQRYPTSQIDRLTKYHATAPLEDECWGWLAELSRAIGAPVRSPDGAVGRPVRTPPARITLATLHTPEIAAYGEWTTRVLEQYAARHGYRSCTETRALDPARPPAWSKIPLIERAFAAKPKCAWVMWVDADALIMQPDVPVTKFLDADADLIGGDDSPHELFNLGVFLLRNGPAVRELLRRAYRKTQFIHHPWWETPAIFETIREGVPGLRVKVVPRRHFNSYPRDYRDGDFALHFAGRPHAERVREIRRLAAPLLGLKFGDAPDHPDPNLNAGMVEEMLRELVVHEFPARRKIRIGSNYDGGYVVPDLQLAGVDFLFTVGVGGNLDFEHDFRARGRARIKLFDPTIAPPRFMPTGAEFFPVGLGMEANSVATLFSFGKPPDRARERLWLKMDIEGWEWKALELTAPNDLGVFEVIIVEFHGLTEWSKEALRRQTACLKKINRQFRLIHAHGNNYAPQMPIGEMVVPDCLEATFLRKDLMPGPSRPNRALLPGPLDAPCNPQVADIDLKGWPFCQTMPGHANRLA